MLPNSVHLFFMAMTVIAWPFDSATAMLETLPNPQAISLEELRDACRSRRRSSLLQQAPNQGELGFFPLTVVESAQSRFSLSRFRNTLSKAEKHLIPGLVRIGKGRAKKRSVWLRAFDHDHSLYNLDQPALGVYFRGKIYLTDGNHKALVSIYHHATTIPIEIIKVFPDKTPIEDFRAEMEELGLGYWRDAFGNPMPMVDICELVNDPNLQLARLLIRRAQVTFLDAADPLQFQINKFGGSDIPLAIKINQDRPFFEIILADTLTRKGKIWKDEKTERDISWRDRRQFLKIFEREKALNPRSPLHNILLVKTVARWQKLDLPKLISGHLRSQGCEHFLHGSAKLKL